MKFNDIYNAVEYIKEKSKAADTGSIFNINGKFLTGKTTLAESILNDFDFLSNYKVFSYVSNWNDFKFYFDISADLFENSNLKHPEFTPGETKFFTGNFFDHLSTMQISNKSLYNDAVDRLMLSTNSDIDENFRNNVEETYQSTLKRRLLLNPKELSVETVLIDLLNNFFPVIEDNVSLSDYLAESKPLKILLIFDDVQQFKNKHNKWIAVLLDYLTNKKLSDLISYEYRGNDKDLLLGDFFKLNLLYISRNKNFLYKFDNSLLTENIELDYLEFNELKEQIAQNSEVVIDYDILEQYPLNSIPALVKYYLSNNKENSIISEIPIYALKHLLKYLPEKLQRVVLFLSIFDEFDERELHLFPEIQLNDNDLEEIVALSEFVKLKDTKLKFTDLEREYLQHTAENIFEDDVLNEIKDLHLELNKNFGDLTYDNFSILAELSLFNNFDKLYTIPNYVKDNSEEINSFIENNNNYFSKNKYTLSVRNDLKKILDKYNKIKYKTEYENIIERISELQKNFKKEISSRNESLSKEIAEVGKEINELESDRDKLEKETDELSKNIIDKKNELNRIDEKLKPFEFKNSKRKKLANILALILSAAVIFNSDRIAEWIFGSSSDFDYVIMLTFVFLLILYFRGLLRYFRTKLKKEELYTLRVNQKNLERELEELNNKIQIKNADIRAANSKIEDLKSHIERMNKQILENKMKVEERTDS